MKTTTLLLPHSMNYGPCQLALVLIPLGLVCFALSPQARSVCQQGCNASTSNTFLGEDALLNNITGTRNTAIGFNALSSNTTGNVNTAIGSDALLNNTIGSLNTAIGHQALEFNTVGTDNTAIGTFALLNTVGGDNTAIGAFALVGFVGSRNIVLGSQAGTNLTSGSNNIYIGDAGIADESRTIHIGTKGVHAKTFIAGISGATVPGGVGVIVGTNGKLGTVVSSARVKEAIKPMDKASEAILALKPVTFRYKHDLDPDGVPQFGLVAEEVEKINSDLVARDEQGKPYTVRYEAVSAMLLNEFLKEHRKGQEQDATISQLQTTIARLEEQVEALAAGLQKVSAQLELSKATPQTVQNSPQAAPRRRA